MNVSDCAQPQQGSAALHHEEIIVIGAGQAGLAMGYWLRQQKRSLYIGSLFSDIGVVPFRSFGTWLSDGIATTGFSWR
jgi:hypothetical protein